MPNAKDSNTPLAHRIFILGDTGSGKTTQFLTLPGKKFAYLFDPNAILSLRGYDVDYEEFLPDRLNVSAFSLSKDKKGDKTTNHPSDLYVQWEKDFDSKLESGFFDKYDAISLDSATTLLDLIMDRILTINGRAGQWPQQDDFGPQMTTFQNIMRTLTGMGKTVYVTGHLETRQDKLTERILRGPLMTGRLKVKIPLLFSDIFIAEAECSSGKKEMSYKIQTVPDRLTTCVRTSLKGLAPFENVTIDFSRPVEGQGIGSILNREKGL